jgi:hypothetical protein
MYSARSFFYLLSKIMLTHIEAKEITRLAYFASAQCESIGCHIQQQHVEILGSAPFSQIER